jgi:60S ribosomal subunit assembly/export protein LOC1
VQNISDKMAIKSSSKGRSSSKSSKSSSALGARRKASSTSKVSRPPPRQVKTKPNAHNPSATSKASKKKQRVYTDAELNLPALNTITPASAAAKPKGSGKKKNKIYVDDREGMMTIMALVNAEKEGQIESKMIKLRQMEEIREARRLEAEKREEERRGRLEGVKKGLKQRKRRVEVDEDKDDGKAEAKRRIDGTRSGKKRVSFA